MEQSPSQITHHPMRQYLLSMSCERQQGSSRTTGRCHPQLCSGVVDEESIVEGSDINITIMQVVQWGVDG